MANPHQSAYAPGEVGVEAKLVLLGSSGVGKTSMVQRYIQGTFDGDQVTTLGAAFVTKRMILKGIKVKLQIWDTAGQERFRAMTPMYYRGADVAIIVYSIDDSESFTKLKDWVKELTDNVETRDILIILCGNKKDRAEECQEVDFEKAKQYADEMGAYPFEVSAKTNEGLTEMFDSICEILCGGVHSGGKTVTKPKPTQQEVRSNRESFRLKYTKEDKEKKKCCK